MDLSFDNLAPLIRAAVVPALLMAAVMQQMRVLNNRLSRIVDRLRWLALQPQGHAHEAEHDEERSVLAQRRRSIYVAFLSAGACALICCLLIALMFVDDVLAVRIDTLLAALFVLAMVAQIASFGFFLHEIWLSMASVTLNIRGSRHLPPR